MELNEEQKEIVERNLNDRVIVNAPPGSGKTETIIQKLTYICQNNLANLKDILVICFSRAAVKEIKNRVEELTGIRNKINIRTIDSFCSLEIKELEDNYKEKFTQMNYDERIEYVIKVLEADTRLKRLKHVIIDEFQDIVGIRAKFVLKLLEVHENGFSIFGDDCQAIFNYQAENMTSDTLIEKILQRFPTCEKIEYKEQHRENDDTQKAKNTLFRFIIKKYKDNPKMINRYMEKIIIPDIKEKKLENIENKKVAILTRQNGEVYEIIKKLKDDISYDIQEYNNYITFPAWIGYIFYDYEKNILPKERLTNLIKERLGKDDTEKYWKYCKEIENIDKFNDLNEYEIDMSTLKENIIIDKGEYPKDFEKKENNLIISTIHKAKGREYDEVYLHFKIKDFVQDKYPENALDNARVLYVALTRAKNYYYKYEDEIRNIFFKSFNDKYGDRYYGFFYKGKGKRYKQIRKIEIRIRRRYRL
jgi:superfamily I DNA/RNA helicase